jgi:sugar lactone lactonase YvrE
MQTKFLKNKKSFFLTFILASLLSSCSFNTIYVESSESNPIELKADFSGNYTIPVSNRNGANIYFKIEPEKSNLSIKSNQDGIFAKSNTDVDHYLVYLIKNANTSNYPSGGDPLADKVVGPFSISASGVSTKTVKFTNVPDSFGEAYYVAIRVKDSADNDLLKDNNDLLTPWGSITQGITPKVAVSSGQGVTVNSIFEINNTTSLSAFLRLMSAVGAKIEGQILNNNGVSTTNTLNISGYNHIITSVAGDGTANFSGDNSPSVKSQINTPNHISADSSGNIYIADTENHRIRRIGIISGNMITGAGIGNIPYTGVNTPIGDGGPAAAAKLLSPQGVYSHFSGNIYIADTGNNRIRRINTSGIISTIAGDGVNSFFGDGDIATNARLSSPKDVKLDLYGNLYIADTGNSRIRKVDSSGIISTVAGSSNPGFSGDGGQATLARLNSPSSIEIDLYGNLYITDTVNNRIRKVDTSGIITTIAGNGTASFGGDNGQSTNANLNQPSSITFDKNSNIYIADSGNGRIRKINEYGIITTIAGIGTGSYSGPNTPVGDNGNATSAKLNFPIGIVTDNYDNLYISERDGNRIRKID